MAFLKKFKPSSSNNPKTLSIWVVVFAIIGISTLLLTNAATPGIPVVVDSSIPNPTNLKTYVDDRVATVTWNPPANPGSSNIIGYYISWGTGSTYTNAKQTVANSAQIQPLVNGTAYNIKVQSVQGSEVSVPTPGAHDGETSTEKRANGRVSTGITGSATSSSARVDQLRTQMTGFFDDFNTSAGPLDELKWNTAGSSCVPPNSIGAFINNQFHAHSQARSSYGSYTYCDRGQVVNRPRAIFDTTGKTEENPGVITFDFDGATMGRDAWYIDLVPLNARKSNVPLDITSHSSIFDDDVADPVILRMIQAQGSIKFSTYDSNKSPTSTQNIFVNCPDFAGFLSFNGDWCGGNFGTQNTSFSPLEEQKLDSNHPGAVANVRRHWRIEISPTKIKLFIDGYRMLEAVTPASVANVRQWTIHNNVFTYNTGKDTPANPTTSILHWDNFGFNGPAQTTDVHNYIDGGPNGTQPFIGRGVSTTGGEVPDGPRATRISIPDQIGNPVKARLMFTMGSFVSNSYTWSSSDHIVVNGRRIDYADPRTNSMQLPITSNILGDGNRPFADSIPLNASDLIQGMNNIQLNIGNDDAIFNVHIELEYNKGSAPTYTQPATIFSASKLMSVAQPALASHDNYLFVEQDFGLPSGNIDSSTPVTPPPTSGDITRPTITLTAPANNTNVTAGSSFTASANASDDVGVVKVEFYLGNILRNTDTTPGYSASLTTAGLNPGSYDVVAVAYDAAGNTRPSLSATIIIPQPPDTTAPNVTVTLPANSATLTGANVSIQATAGDASGISKVDFYIDSNLISSDTTDPYTATLDSTAQTNGPHNITARAFDTNNNSATSPVVPVTINNAVADTTLPNVAISAPTAGATISGTTAFIQATASDNTQVASVEFFVDGVSLGTPDSSPPYTASMNTTQYTNATHALTARARDTSNNTRTSVAVSVTVNNVIADTTAPSIVITSPTSGATISGTYNIGVTAADTSGVSKVEFSLDNGAVAFTDLVAPYNYSLNTTGLSNGAHTINVKAFDTPGNSRSASVNVTVNNGPAPVAKCDVTGDGRVNIQDLVILLNNYGKTVTSGTNGDCNNSGTVNIQDLVILIGQYGQ